MTETPKFSPVGLTFDDVLLLPAHSELMPSEADTSTRITRKYSLRMPLVSQRDGHGDRGADGDRDGPPRRRRRAAQEPVRRGAGAAGGPGQALGGRDGHRPGDLRPRGHARGRGAALRALPDLRRAGDHRRRHARRHRHQPGHPVRDRPVPPGQGRDDQDAAGHRPGRGRAGRGARAAQGAQDREAAADRRRRAPARADHRQGLHQEREVPARHQGRERPPGRRRRGRRRRGRQAARPGADRGGRGLPRRGHRARPRAVACSTWSGSSRPTPTSR